MDVHTFLKNISPKMNVIIRGEFELAYQDVTVKHVNHEAAETSPRDRKEIDS